MQRSRGARRAQIDLYALELVRDRRERRPLNRIGLKAPGGKREDAKWAAGRIAQLVERGGLTSDNDRHERAQVFLRRRSGGQSHMAVRYGPRPHVCEHASEAPHVGGLGFCARGERKGLGSHVGRRARWPLGLPGILGEFGAKVRHLGNPLLRE